jgi:hypothetical protein
LFYIPKKREKEKGVGEGMMIGALERSTKKKSSQEEEALLWVDKYRPKTLDTLDIHPEWTEKLSR